MENKKLAGKLREISRSTSSSYKKQIFKQAARRIEEQAAQLEKVRPFLLLLAKILPGMDGGCDLCEHRDPNKLCLVSDEMVFCNNCPSGCYCQDCTPDGSKWENSLLKEVLQEGREATAAKCGGKGAERVAGTGGRHSRTDGKENTEMSQQEAKNDGR